MKLIAAVVDEFVNDLATRLSGGSLEFYDGKPPAAASAGMATFRSPLVSFRFLTPGFDPAVGGTAQMVPLQKAIILQSGNAKWARLVTAAEQPIAILSVAQEGTEEAVTADLVCTRLDFSQGGFCDLEGFALKLPAVG